MLKADGLHNAPLLAEVYPTSPPSANMQRLVPSGLRMPDVNYARCDAPQAPVSSRAVGPAPFGCILADSAAWGCPAVRPHAAPGRYPAANAAGRDIRAVDGYLHGWTGSRLAMSVVE